MKTYILSGDNWIEGQPVKGQKYKKVDNGGELITYFEGASEESEYNPVIRKITKGSFRSRLTQAEQADYMGLLLAGNIAINVIDGMLRDTSHVDLDDAETIYSANALESEGVLKTSARVQELLEDGKQKEAFKG
jgi:hypothetical protein